MTEQKQPQQSNERPQTTEYVKKSKDQAPQQQHKK